MGGDLVVVAGPPETHANFVMVPIKPEGAVELRLFQVEGFAPGTELRCFRAAEGEDDEGLPVFESVTSDVLIDTKRLKDVVVVSGPPHESDGYMMVPIEPTGAVEFNLFTINDEMADELAGKG